jgi:biotin carboxylase
VTRVGANATGRAITAGFDAALAATREDAVLVEEFVVGPEFSVEAITWRGMTRVVAVTDKLTSGAPHFVELGHSQPSRFGQADLDALRSTAIAAVAALGIDDAASHTEIRLGAAGPRIMESAARLGGGFINSHLVPASCGVDIVRAAIAVALGREPDLEPRALQGSAIRFLTAPPGRIESVDGLDVARSMPGVMEAVSYVSRGDEFGALRDASGRLGHVIARGATASEAVRRAESALAALHVRTRPAPRVGSHD